MRLPSPLVSRILVAAVVSAGAAAEAMPSQGGAPPPSRFTAAPVGPVNEKAWVELKSGERVSLFSAKHRATPVARVGADVITLQEFTTALAEIHDDRGGPTPLGMKDFKGILERLIKLRLGVLEAEQMGVGELPEVRARLVAQRTAVMRAMIRDRVTANIVPDAAEVERIYQLAIREWKLKSVLFEKEADAQAMVDQLRQGAQFDALAAQLVAEKKAHGGDEGVYVNTGQMLPEIAARVEAMKVGESTPAVPVATGFAVFKVEDLRRTDAPAARDAAEQISLGRLHAQAQQKHVEELVRRYARIDRRLFERLDFEQSVAAFEKLEKDRRALATISGASPITVADLAAELRKKFFHGVERAVSGKKINEHKTGAFNQLLLGRLLDRQAVDERLDRTPEFAERMEEHRKSILFGLFVAKVIAPDVKVTPEEIQAHFDRNRAEFTDPEFYRLQSLGFVNAQHARSALGKLKAGTDLRWMGANAAGLAPEEVRRLGSDGSLVMATSLPPELRTAIGGARVGEYRQYASKEGVHYVVRIAEHVPPKPRRLEDVRGGIEKELVAQNLSRALEEWMGKARAAVKTEIYVTQIGM
jgi:hypothetical protein